MTFSTGPSVLGKVRHTHALKLSILAGLNPLMTGPTKKTPKSAESGLSYFPEVLFHMHFKPSCHFCNINNLITL
jgi:hypothetical protein